MDGGKNDNNNLDEEKQESQDNQENEDIQETQETNEQEEIEEIKVSETLTEEETEQASEAAEEVEVTEEETEQESEVAELEKAEETEADMPEIEITREMAEAEYFVSEEYEDYAESEYGLEPKQRFVEWLFEWIEIFSAAFVTMILVLTFIVRLVSVQGISMQETLHDRDNLIILHLLLNPKQGDIVVIHVPDPHYSEPIIKRVIATEGQEIDFDFESWTVYVDGEPLNEPYVNIELGRYMSSGGLPRDSLPIKVEKGKIFVMGDNRNYSSDSRDQRIGQVDKTNVVGRVLIRVYPFNKFGLVKPNES